MFGSTDFLDDAFEIKNAALSAHPDTWRDMDFSDPTLTARLGYRPDAAWAFGLSASCGPWMEEDAPGLNRDDFVQSTLGLDARWAYHDLIISGEVVMSEFETPAAGDLRTARRQAPPRDRRRLIPYHALPTHSGGITRLPPAGVISARAPRP